MHPIEFIFNFFKKLKNTSTGEHPLRCNLILKITTKEMVISSASVPADRKKLPPRKCVRRLGTIRGHNMFLCFSLLRGVYITAATQKRNKKATIKFISRAGVKQPQARVINCFKKMKKNCFLLQKYIYYTCRRITICPHVYFTKKINKSICYTCRRIVYPPTRLFYKKGQHTLPHMTFSKKI